MRARIRAMVHTHSAPRALTNLTNLTARLPPATDTNNLFGMAGTENGAPAATKPMQARFDQFNHERRSATRSQLAMQASRDPGGRGVPSRYGHRVVTATAPLHGRTRSLRGDYSVATR